MNRTIRIAISLATFATVAILGIADRAPYVGVQEASADKDGKAICLQGCKRSATKECGGDNQCWNACVCGQPPKGNVCSPRAPCMDGQRCMNGICATPCTGDADCETGGGACHVGFCGRRSPAELASCQSACTTCKGKMQKCRTEAQRCISKC